MKKLTPAQLKFMQKVCAAAADGNRHMQPSTNGVDSVRALAAWHRTAKSLVKMGYVVMIRHGDTYSVCLPFLADIV